MTRGIFIVIEGLDKSGKSTQINLLSKTLSKVQTMEFPDRTTNVGKMIDNYLSNNNKQKLNDQCIHLLFAANRWEKKDEIMDILKSGKNIICSRYTYSGVAYSSAKGLNYEWCINTEKGLPKPDILFYLDVNTKTSSSRAGYGNEIYENVIFQNNVGKIFQKIVSEDNDIIVIDGNKSVDQVHCEMKKYIDKFLQKKNILK